MLVYIFYNFHNHVVHYYNILITVQNNMVKKPILYTVGKCGPAYYPSRSHETEPSAICMTEGG